MNDSRILEMPQPRKHLPVLIRSLCLVAALVLTEGCQEDAAVGTVPQRPLPILPPDPVPAWLDANVLPFDGTHLSLPHTDIEFLRDIVGDARIVALGEGTHGTRHFFEMKARILRFLVEEMGFNTFAIEATWPESRLLDRYVRTGEGDPEVLLSRLYYWTWRTQSVLEMIEWMRAHNEAGGDVGFHGFDMGFPAMALGGVREYVHRVDPDSTELIAGKLDCLARFANDHRGRFPSPRYRDQSTSYRAECGSSLGEVRQTLLSHQEEYEALAGEDAFEVALQSLRVAFQYHLQATGQQSRDQSMAENTEWISRRIGPEGHMVLWAHNYHVSTEPGAQGSYLRATFGEHMVVVGFSHESGAFTAVDLEAPRGPVTFPLDPVMPGSFEASFAKSAAPRFVLDLRDRDTRTPGTYWLDGEHLFRDIGCCYRASAPGRYWLLVPLTSWYDVIIHFESTRPTTILPARYPESW